MQTMTSQKYWLVGFALLLLAGCSMSRGSLARGGKESDVDQLGEKTANADNADADAPPAQPGVKQPGSGRKKLTGWLSNVAPKRESIPLERTDSVSSADADESDADEGSGFWKHSDGSSAVADSKVAKSNSPGKDEDNPFEE